MTPRCDRIKSSAASRGFISGPSPKDATRRKCRADGLRWPHLIVVPLSTLENWEREFAAWASHLNVVKFHGRQSARDVIKQHEFFTPGRRDNLQVWGLASDIDFLHCQTQILLIMLFLFMCSLCNRG